MQSVAQFPFRNDILKIESKKTERALWVRSFLLVHLDAERRF